MNQKILITGMQRSGTTMLRRMFQHHPDIEFMLHEKHSLTKKGKNFKRLLGDFNCGEKNPYWAACQYTRPYMIEYAKKWQATFKCHKIIHIVRHPVSVAESNKKKSKTSPKASIKYWKNDVKPVANFISKQEYGLNISYENLVSDQIYFQKVLDFCNLDASSHVVDKIYNTPYRHFDKIEPQRSLNFSEDYSGIDYNSFKNEYCLKI